MHRKVNGLVLDVGKGASALNADKVQRHMEESADFLRRELPRFKKLSLIVWQRDWREGHVLFENGELQSV